jgi:hypothetical protein
MIIKRKAAYLSKSKGGFHERKYMFVEMKHMYWKLLSSFKEKRLRRQKALIQIKMMSGYIRRVK